MKTCKNCNNIIFEWRTKTGVERLSGETCECQVSHTIYQYPNDLQTKESNNPV